MGQGKKKNILNIEPEPKKQPNVGLEPNLQLQNWSAAKVTP